MQAPDHASLHQHLDRISDLSARAVRTSPEAAMALLVHLVEGQGTDGAEKHLAVQLAQFVLSTHAIGAALEDGDLSAIGDWIGHSLSEQVIDSPQSTLEVRRLGAFFSAPAILEWRGFIPTMVTYFNGFYYYARRRTAMKDVGEEFWTMAQMTFHTCMRQPPFFPPEVMLGVSMLTWAAKESESRAKEFAPVVEGYVNNAVIPAGARALYCLSLATTAGRFSSTSPLDWAGRALGEFSQHLVEGQRVQMMVTLLQADSSVDKLEAVLDEMACLQSSRRARHGPLEFARAAALGIESVLPFFVKCAEIGNGSALLRGLVNWHQLSTELDALDPNELLVAIPFGETSYTLLSGGQRFVAGGNRHELLVRLVRETDAFLGTVQTVAKADNSKLVVPERIGHPNAYAESDWSDTLREAYCLPSAQVPGAPTSQILLPTVGHPVQTVQLRAWGKTWPIAASLTRPRGDRAVRRVAVWSGGGSLTEDMEIDAVRVAFDRASVAVEVFRPDACTTTDFLSAYTDPSYDVFWVMSHGEFDHWSPQNVKLQLARDGTSASLEELHGMAPSESGRRLLVLNVCDGARFSETGLLPHSGLAASLSAPWQATVSHLWPVMGYPSAAFGALLALELSAGTGFFDSFVRALGAMQRTAADIAQHIEATLGFKCELAERLSRQVDDYSPIQISGSPAFFQ